MSLTTAAIVILSLWVVAIVIAGLVMTLRPGGVGVQFKAAGTAPVSGSGDRQEIPLGGVAEVFGNFRGNVVGVLLRPDDRRLEGIQLGGGLQEAETVPVSAIAAADGNTVSLSDGWQDQSSDLHSGLATLKENMPVVGSDGKRLGRLRVVCFDPSSFVVTALVAEGRGALERRLVPIDRVAQAGPENVLVNLRTAEAGTLPVYATDWELRQAILERLAADSELEVLQRSLRIDVRDQRVRVQGNVADQSKADAVGRAIRGVPGVLDLQLKLTTDEQLGQAVKDALARDQATASIPLSVNVRSGVVDITGEAPNRSVLRRIDAITQDLDGVQVVHNMVVVRPGTPAPAAS